MSGPTFRKAHPWPFLQPTSRAFRLSPEDEEELVVALQNIRQGNFVDGDELLRDLSVDL
jgi:hypothetical protein